jgi:hypothetical protein
MPIQRWFLATKSTGDEAAKFLYLLSHPLFLGFDVAPIPLYIFREMSSIRKFRLALRGGFASNTLLEGELR